MLTSEGGQAERRKVAERRDRSRIECKMKAGCYRCILTQDVLVRGEPPPGSVVGGQSRKKGTRWDFEAAALHTLGEYYSAHQRCPRFETLKRSPYVSVELWLCAPCVQKTSVSHYHHSENTHLILDPRA